MGRLHQASWSILPAFEASRARLHDCVLETFIEQKSWVSWFAFYCCDKEQPKTTWGGECLSQSLQGVTRESWGRNVTMTETHSQELKQRAQRVLLIDSLPRVHWTSYLIPSGPPAQGQTIHTSLDPPTLIINQEKVPTHLSDYRPIW